jgi:septal ring factor EnvC (AmiA/AmiB activator)
LHSKTKVWREVDIGLRRGLSSSEEAAAEVAEEEVAEVAEEAAAEEEEEEEEEEEDEGEEYAKGVTICGWPSVEDLRDMFRSRANSSIIPT